MAYKKSYFSKSSKKKPSQFSKYKAKARRVMAKSYKQETPYISFEKRVQSVLKKNIEDKISNTYITRLPVANWNIVTGGSSPVWFSFRDFNNGALLLGQGSGQNERVGNRILLKHLYVNLLITPDQGGDTKMDLYLANSQMGYVTLYVCRQRNREAVPTRLDEFLQLGNSSTFPSGNYQQLMFDENKDRYQILYKRRFKCGASQGKGITGTESNFMTSNNDFKVNHMIKLDLAKYIKDKIIRYNDTATPAINADSGSLAVVATWQPYQGSLVAGAQYTNSYFNINSSSWAVYEDA